MWELVEVVAVLAAAVGSGVIGGSIGYLAGRSRIPGQPCKDRRRDNGVVLNQCEFSELDSMMGTEDVPQESFGPAVEALTPEELAAIEKRLHAHSTTVHDAVALFAEVRRLIGEK